MDKINIAGYHADFYDISLESDLAVVLSVYRDIFRDKPASIPSDPRYLKVLVEHNPNCLDSFAMVLSCNGFPIGLVLGRVEKQIIDVQIGRISFFKSERRSLLIAEGGIFIKDDDDSYNKKILIALLQTFSLKKFEVIIMHWIPVDSKFYMKAVKKVKWFFRVYSPIVDKHWYTDLPSSCDKLLSNKSSKQKFNLRRIVKRIENESKINFHYKKFTNEESVTTLLEDAEIVARSTYQRKLGIGFYHSKHVDAIVREASSTNNLLGYVLYADSKPCAFQLGINQGSTHHLVYMAHNPEFSHYSPGTYLLFKFLELICSSEDVKVVDYGWSDGAHKSKFGTRYDDEANLIYLSPSISSFFLSISLNFIRFAVVFLKQRKWILDIYTKGTRDHKKNLNRRS